MARSLISFTFAAVAAAALGACGGGEDGDDEERAQNYALQVERISDHAYETAQGSLVTLNRLSDGSVGAHAATAELGRSSGEIIAERDRLADLAPPEAGKQVAEDLAFQLASLALSLDEAAATASAVSKGGEAFATPDARLRGSCSLTSPDPLPSRGACGVS